MNVMKCKYGELDIERDITITDPTLMEDSFYSMSDVLIKSGKYNCSCFIGGEWDDSDYEEYYEAVEWSDNALPKEVVELSDKGRCMAAQIELFGSNLDFLDNRWKKVGEIGITSMLAGFFLNFPVFSTEMQGEKFLVGIERSKVVIDNRIGFCVLCDASDFDLCSVYAVFDDNKEVIAIQIRFDVWKD